MINIRDWIKSTENLKIPKKGWLPHESPEKGTNTLAYGHKLSQAEHDGNYVVLPDGRIHDFDTDGGLSAADADLLLDADLSRASKVVEKQWDSRKLGIPYASLDDKYKAVLTDIGFQTGSLNTKTGKPSWKKLAKAIVADDVEAAINESTTTFVRDGVRKADARRNKIKKKVLEGTDVVTLPQSTPTTPSQPLSEDLAPTTTPSVPQENAPLVLSEEKQSLVDQMMQERSLASAATEAQDKITLSPEKQALVDSMIHTNTRANREAGRTVEGIAGREERTQAEFDSAQEEETLDNLF